MAFCTSCGNPLTGSVYCVHCGAKVAPQAPSASQATDRHSLPPADPAVALRVTSPAPLSAIPLSTYEDSADSATLLPTRARRGRVIAIVAAVVVLLGSGGTYLAMRGGGPRSSAVQAPASVSGVGAPSPAPSFSGSPLTPPDASVAASPGSAGVPTESAATVTVTSVAVTTRTAQVTAAAQAGKDALSGYFRGLGMVDASQYLGTDGDPGFVAPSGNISCGITPGGENPEATCDIYVHDFPIDGGACSDAGAVGTAFFERDEGASVLCSDGGHGGVPTLNYGTELAYGGMRCASNKDGIACQDTVTGAGFHVARGGFTAYGAGGVIRSIIGSSAAPSSPSSGGIYRNARFGFSVPIPVGWAVQPPSDNGDGIRFSANDGSTIDVSGSNTIGCSTAGQCLAERAPMLAEESGMDVTYQVAKGSAYVISGFTDDGRIYYERTFVGPGSTDSLVFLYPTSVKATMDPVVDALTAGFHPGNLSVPH